MPPVKQCTKQFAPKSTFVEKIHWIRGTCQFVHLNKFPISHLFSLNIPNQFRKTFPLHNIPLLVDTASLLVDEHASFVKKY